MKKLFTSTALLIFLVTLSSFTVVSESISEKKLLGTWEYSVPDAPYEYQTGDLVFEKSEGKLIGYTLVSGYKTPVNDITIDGSKVNFNMDMQGTPIMFDLVFTKNAFMGTVTYSEGSLSMTGKKKE